MHENTQLDAQIRVVVRGAAVSVAATLGTAVTCYLTDAPAWLLSLSMAVIVVSYWAYLIGASVELNRNQGDQ